MRPFLALAVLSSDDDELTDYWDFTENLNGPHQAMADAMTAILSPWLETYDLNRLILLFDCLGGVREPIVVWAAYVARVDVLIFVHDQYDLRGLSKNLLVAGVAHLNVLTYLHSIGYDRKTGEAAREAAIRGHTSSLSFLLAEFQVPHEWLSDNTIEGISFGGYRSVVEMLLPRIVPNPDWLRHVTSYAASYDHLNLANWLFRQMVELDISMDVDGEAFECTLSVASNRGNLEGLQWLLAIINQPTRLVELETHCLVVAIRFEQRLVVEWLVPRVSPSTLVQAYLANDANGTMLHYFIDPEYDVPADEIVEVVHRWSLEKMLRVFETFSKLKQRGTFRTEVLKRCLHQMVWFGRRLELVECFVDWMDFVDVQDVVLTQKALHRGLQRGGVAMLDFFETQNIHLTPAEMDDELFVILRQVSDKSILPGWLNIQDNKDQDMSDMDKIAQWFVMRRDGPVATLRHMLVRLAQGKKTLLQFKTLYAEWLTVVKDEAERKSVVKKCLQHSTEIQQYFESRLASDPSLFVLMATTLRLGTVQRIHAAIARTTTADKLLCLESDALVEAAEAGHCGIVEFLLNKMSGKDKGGIHRAREAALASSCTTAMLELFRQYET
ncbi:Aste57867_3456 [Aphanomyces stellatus]|nr:hypothetical protein As57867_003446 [Aphanomyces stellatus]VFT80622.1 Aste57867_3456 [Aphanomyces stellatus]